MWQRPKYVDNRRDIEGDRHRMEDEHFLDPGTDFGRPKAGRRLGDGRRPAKGQPDKNGRNGTMFHCCNVTMVQCCNATILQLYKNAHNSAGEKAVKVRMIVAKSGDFNEYDGGKGAGMWKAFEERHRGSP